MSTHRYPKWTYRTTSSSELTPRYHRLSSDEEGGEGGEEGEEGMWSGNEGADDQGCCHYSPHVHGRGVEGPRDDAECCAAERVCGTTDHRSAPEAAGVAVVADFFAAPEPGIQALAT